MYGQSPVTGSIVNGMKAMKDENESVSVMLRNVLRTKWSTVPRLFVVSKVKGCVQRDAPTSTPFQFGNLNAVVLHGKMHSVPLSSRCAR